MDRYHYRKWSVFGIVGEKMVLVRQKPESIIIYYLAFKIKAVEYIKNRRSTISLVLLY